MGIKVVPRKLKRPPKKRMKPTPPKNRSGYRTGIEAIAKELKSTSTDNSISKEDVQFLLDAYQRMKRKK